MHLTRGGTYTGVSQAGTLSIPEVLSFVAPGNNFSDSMIPQLNMRVSFPTVLILYTTHYYHSQATV